jgi:NADH:ubiquinone oxidoreductase subunit K
MRQAVQSWLLFVSVPSAVLFAVSRLGVLESRPWLLLFLGPVLFVMAAVVATVMYNILFASSQSG